MGKRVQTTWFKPVQNKLKKNISVVVLFCPAIICLGTMFSMLL